MTTEEEPDIGPNWTAYWHESWEVPPLCTWKPQPWAPTHAACVGSAGSGAPSNPAPGSVWLPLAPHSLTCAPAVSARSTRAFAGGAIVEPEIPVSSVEPNSSSPLAVTRGCVS